MAAALYNGVRSYASLYLAFEELRSISGGIFEILRLLACAKDSANRFSRE
tara:strand:- start:1052 stop:1201 length:150 start_codon:yes stop_codon:yes gene_type:complete